MSRVLFALVLLSACREQRALRWEGRFVNPADADRTRSLEAEVVEGGCAPGVGRSIYRAERMPPDALPAVPALAEGVYGFHLRARDERCLIIAAGCAEVVLPLPDGALVTTSLEPVAETAPCPICVAGGCVGSDSGVDLPDAGMSLPAPALRWPWHGWTSGTDLSPRFRWEPVSGATHYELEVDDGCAEGPATQACFDAPLLLRTASTELAPSDLAIDAAPIGRRYQWRVRACEGPMDETASCSPASPARWIDVGRSDADFDGDGDADLLAGAPTSDATFTDEGIAYVFSGDASGLSETPTRTLDHPEPDGDGWFGSAVSVGDIDGDGYADAVIGAEEDDGAGVTDSGLAYVVFGSSSGLSTSRVVRLEPPAADASAYFGQSVAIVGDIDGDGDRDVVVGAGMTDLGGTDAGVAYFYRGARENMESAPAQTLALPAPSDGSRFGMSVAAAGDVDGDGFPDVIVGAPYENAGATDRGRAYLLRGSPEGLRPPSPIEPSSSEAYSYYGWSLAGGDFDGDGFSDVAIGAPFEGATSADDDRGRTHVHPGSRAGLGAPVVVLDSTQAAEYAHSGWTLAAGDVDADGFFDLAIAAPAQDNGGSVDAGIVALFRGSASGLTQASAVEIEVSPTTGNMELGRSLSFLDVDRDGRADLAAGAHQWRNAVGSSYVGRVYVFAAIDLGVPAWILESPSGEAYGRFGWSLATSVGRTSDRIGHTPDG